MKLRDLRDSALQGYGAMKAQTITLVREPVRCCSRSAKAWAMHLHPLSKQRGPKLWRQGASHARRCQFTEIAMEKHHESE